MATKEQLTQWRQIVKQMRGVGFGVSKTTPVVRVGDSYTAEHLEAVVTHNGRNSIFQSSSYIRDRDPNWSPEPIRSVTLTRPLQEGQDFTCLPTSRRPLEITLSYEEEEDPERLAKIREQLMVVGQKKVSTNEIDSEESKIDSEYDLVTKGELRFYQVFQRSHPRTDCSFEIDISPYTTRWFDQGLLPNHTRQGNHFCEITPTIPLFPLPLGEHIKDFVGFFYNLQSLPARRFAELFRGMVLPPQFAIYYGNHPTVIIDAGFGGRKLDMEVTTKDVEADKVAKALHNYIGLFDQYYAGYQSY